MRSEIPAAWRSAVASARVSPLYRELTSAAGEIYRELRFGARQFANEARSAFSEFANEGRATFHEAIGGYRDLADEFRQGARWFMGAISPFVQDTRQAIRDTVGAYAHTVDSVKWLLNEAGKLPTAIPPEGRRGLAEFISQSYLEASTMPFAIPRNPSVRLRTPVPTQTSANPQSANMANRSTLDASQVIEAWRDNFQETVNKAQTIVRR
jgi:hypothetical protein